MRFLLLLLPQRYEFSSKSQLKALERSQELRCCCYRKGTNFQANHNTTPYSGREVLLLLLPQRYEFSSKSQLNYVVIRKMQGCCCYRKGTNFQANHNSKVLALAEIAVVVATAKVRIFKQITTYRKFCYHIIELLLLPQRYEFSSKSQLYKQYNE